MKSRLNIAAYGNAIIIFAFAVYFLLVPGGIIINNLRDPGLSTGETPRFAFRWHRSLSIRFEKWARERVASGRATKLSLSNISGTEWPLFSTVFYLWATDSLQKAWEEHPSLAPEMPKEYARGAIEAAGALVADPNQAAWVKTYWGEDYLHRQDLFYRMLLINGLTSYQNLTGKDTYQPLLQDQVETLSKEIDESPYGLLDDYPGQCYPIDLLPAIAGIRRADAILGTDHSAFVNRAVRAFEGSRLDPATGLPTYVANPNTGHGFGSARGVALSFMLAQAPDLWPDTAQQWYRRYQKYFWQEGVWVAGVREFPKAYPIPDWWLDVDAGPVMFGYGTAASAYGIGAARAFGDMEQAYPLSAEALVAAWPLADGTLLAPRLLSNLSDAPYTGEAALLYNLTVRPKVNGVTAPNLHLPGSVYLALCFYFFTGLALIAWAGLRLARWRKSSADKEIPFPVMQLSTWLILVILGLVAFLFSWLTVGGVLLGAAQFLPSR